MAKRKRHDVDPNDTRKGQRWEDWELNWLRKNYDKMTDEELALELNRTKGAIISKRYQLDLSKTKQSGGRRNPAQEKAVRKKKEKYAPMVMAEVEKEEKIEALKDDFSKHPRYFQLKDTLKTEEFDYYKVKYIEYMQNVDTITPQEEDLMHYLLMCDIEATRLRNIQKQKLEEENEILDFSHQIDKLEKRYMDYFKQLDITREQRLKKHKEEKTTISSLIREYIQSDEARVKDGKEAANMMLSADRCKQEMMKSGYLMNEGAADDDDIKHTYQLKNSEDRNNKTYIDDEDMEVSYVYGEASEKG